MIEIIREESWDSTQEKTELPKNIKQIGSPDIGDRIYIENQAYEYLHPYNSLAEKSAYIMLGKFENFGGRQCTFIEAAIRLEEICFEGQLPIWNDDTWAYIYRKLKHEYDDMVIVGWAMDIRGQLPNLTAPLEKLHRTYFGGEHQVLFLIDSLEKEEAFFNLKKGYLSRREGYYIYYDKTIPVRLTTAREDLQKENQKSESENDMENREIPDWRAKIKSNWEPEDLGLEESKEHMEEHFFRSEQKREPIYRNYLRNQAEKKVGVPAFSSTFLLLVVVVALGFAAFRNYEKMSAMEQTLAQMNAAQTMFTAEDTQTAAAVTVEKVSGGVERETPAATETTSTEGAATEIAGTESSATGQVPGTESQSTESAANTAQITEETTASGTDTQSAENQSTQTPADSTQQTTETLSEAETYLSQGYYIVQKGDSLVGICKKIYQTTAMMDKLCEVNGIDDPDSIYAGQYLTLPN